MPRFRKKPVVVDAIQFDDSIHVLNSIQDFMGADDVIVSYNDPDAPVLKIPTLEGVMAASVGDWIIRGVKGEFYPCKPDVFEATYEQVAE